MNDADNWNNPMAGVIDRPETPPPAPPQPDGMLTMQDRAVLAAAVNTINGLRRRIEQLEASCS